MFEATARNRRKKQVFTLANSTLNDFSKKVERNRDTNYIGYTYIDTCSNLEYYESTSNSFPGMTFVFPYVPKRTDV